jgi:prepilin-type N-terminal cleavage/methylation domain-containing protein
LNAARRQHGFSFVEIMVAVLLLAICAVPMGDAIRNGITASSIAAAKARELRCIKNTMETVLAEPYQSLYAAAAGKDQLAALPLAADASCDAAPRVSIARYERENGAAEVWLDGNVNPGDPRLESPLLYITVAAKGGYSFTTLVAR